jgi:hypothetical protein
MAWTWYKYYKIGIDEIDYVNVMVGVEQNFDL